MHQFMGLLALMGGLSDLHHILKYFPLPPIWKRFRQIETTLITARAEMGADARKDIYSELIRDPETGAERSIKDMVGDMDLIVVAGSGEL